jgi:hypothetical protein
VSVTSVYLCVGKLASHAHDLPVLGPDIFVAHSAFSGQTPSTCPVVGPVVIAVGRCHSSNGHSLISHVESIASMAFSTT